MSEINPRYLLGMTNFLKSSVLFSAVALLAGAAPVSKPILKAAAQYVYKADPALPLGFKCTASNECVYETLGDCSNICWANTEAVDGGWRIAQTKSCATKCEEANVAPLPPPPPPDPRHFVRKKK